MDSGFCLPEQVARQEDAGDTTFFLAQPPFPLLGYGPLIYVQPDPDHFSCLFLDLGL